MTSHAHARRPAVIVDTARSPHARLRPVPMDAVTLADTFWEPRRQINRTTTLPSQYRLCEETGRIDNFRRAAGKRDLPFQGLFFNDSDVYKWLEAAAWTLAGASDPSLSEMLETVVTEIADAQQPDGYLNTYFMFDRASDRWTNLKDMHELYCAGHLLQAAVAHRRTTGSERLLDVARRLADHICATFGPEEEGKRPGTCGHEEIEMALVELARETGDLRYLRQAQFFVDVRGRGVVGGSRYHQDHRPFRDLDRMIGHAVRHAYLCAGAADVYAETGDSSLRTALDRLWDNATGKQMYVSGGIGSRYEGEAFGKDYELPNERAYTETCAAIGSVMWNGRMLALTADARYADLLEWTLYNAVLPGVSLDGQTYFYQNPLADDGSHRRQAWFGCACCPPNVARLLASLPGYFYTVSEEGPWVHLYARGSARIALPDGREVGLTIRTAYPWDEEIEVVLEESDGQVRLGEFSLFLRVPDWCESGAALLVNGLPFEGPVEPDSYARVRRAWAPGDTVRLRLPMPVRRIESHPYAAENRDCVALARGPLLYCAEQVDHPGVDLRDLGLPEATEITADYHADLLGGVVVLRGEAALIPPDPAWAGRLYRTARARPQTPIRPVEATFVPYYAWANREPGAMRVWIRAARSQAM